MKYCNDIIVLYSHRLFTSSVSSELIKGLWIGPLSPAACPLWLSLSRGPALATGLITGQHAARTHTLTLTQTTSWTPLSITPRCYSADLATGGLVCHRLHLQTDKLQTHWNTHTSKHSFPISLQLTHTHTHIFPLLLALCNPTYTLPTPTSLVTWPDQGQLSRPAVLDVKALTQHGHLCLSREISTRLGQRNRAPCGTMLSQPLSMSLLSLLILSQITPHVCRQGTRMSCKLNMSGRQICEDSWGMLAGESRM